MVVADGFVHWTTTRGPPTDSSCTEATANAILRVPVGSNHQATIVSGTVTGNDTGRPWAITHVPHTLFWMGACGEVLHADDDMMMQEGTKLTVPFGACENAQGIAVRANGDLVVAGGCKTACPDTTANDAGKIYSVAPGAPNSAAAIGDITANSNAAISIGAAASGEWAAWIDTTTSGSGYQVRVQRLERWRRRLFDPELVAANTGNVVADAHSVVTDGTRVYWFGYESSDSANL